MQKQNAQQNWLGRLSRDDYVSAHKENRTARAKEGEKGKLATYKEQKQLQKPVRQGILRLREYYHNSISVSTAATTSSSRSQRQYYSKIEETQERERKRGMNGGCYWQLDLFFGFRVQTKPEKQREEQGS